MSELTLGGQPVADAGDGSSARGAERRARRRRRRRVTIVVAVVVVLLLGGFVAWYEFQANPLGGPGRQVVVVVQNREAAGTVIDQLASDGVIASSFAFRLSDIVHGTPTVVPGGYLFHVNQSFSTVRSILHDGPDVFPLDVVAGFTLSEIAERVADLPIPVKGSFVDLLKGGTVTSAFSPPGSTSLEGSVAPGQYLVLPGEHATTLLQEMVGRFDKSASSLDLDAAANALGVTPAQLLIVASIVQKEGVYTQNMGKVARVIYNRLAAGMPLQMDSTILYSLGQDGGPVTAADLALNTPYNTYLHDGLPPTAICTPSLAALRAAAHPTPGAWLYFELISKNGTEQFSDTYAEQLAAEQLAASRGLP
jgi:UPF0755 protein